MVTPFLKYPKLLSIFTAALQSEQSPSLRRELLRVLGIIGAVDPHEHAKRLLEVCVYGSICYCW